MPTLAPKHPCLKGFYGCGPQGLEESFAVPLRSPAVSLVDADPDSLDVAEDMMGEQFSWLALLLNYFAEKGGYEAVAQVKFRCLIVWLCAWGAALMARRDFYLLFWWSPSVVGFEALNVNIRKSFAEKAAFEVAAGVWPGSALR